MSEGTVRKLAAIVSADVVGYSRLMGENEAATLNALRAHRSELIDPLIAEHGGRIVKTMGDGLLLAFPSVVEAVACAVAVQQGMAERNADVADDIAVRFRIGVHLGDVIVEGGDIFGDGVNIAARLQEISEAGGIAISGTAHDNIVGRVDAAFIDAGDQELKNIARPVRMWQWSVVDDTPLPASDEEPLALPDKPSIAVLPFDNMSGDAEQEYFSDGITEDIITNLSRIHWLFVIARNSSFVYRGRAVDVRQVSEELGVRYILEGSVRKAANKVRITAQLIDAQTSAHLWAERYDRDLTDIFTVQDEITEDVAGAIEPAILAAEGLRATRRSEYDLDAWDIVMQAVSAFWHMTKDENAKAVALLEAATQRYPQYGPAHSMLAFALLFASHMGWTKFASVRERAGKWAQKAYDLEDQDAWAHIALGYMHAMNRNIDEAILEYTKAIDLSPNFAAAYGWRAFAKAHAGLSEQAIADANLALRLSPKDPHNVIFVAAIGLAHYLAERYEEAERCAVECTRLRPGFLSAYRLHCAALARGGQIAKAQTVLEKLRELQPDICGSVLRRTLPYSSPEILEKFVGGLSMAGLPD
jgi:TolB-like protein